MLVKNKEIWGENVRIVGISVDETKEEIIERVNSKNWKDVNHFYIGGWK